MPVTLFPASIAATLACPLVYTKIHHFNVCEDAMTDAGEKLRTLEQRYTHWINNDQYDRDDYDPLDFFRIELERAAEIADYKETAGPVSNYSHGYKDACDQMAAAIRRRKE